MTVERRTIPGRAILQALVFVVVVPLLPLLISREWDWWEAWVFAAVSIGLILADEGRQVHLGFWTTA